MKSFIGSCPWYQMRVACAALLGCINDMFSEFPDPSDGFLFSIIGTKEKWFHCRGKSNSKPQPELGLEWGQEVKNSCLNAFVPTHWTSRFLQERMIYQFKPVRYRIGKTRMGRPERATNARMQASCSKADVRMTSGSMWISLLSKIRLHR